MIKNGDNMKIESTQLLKFIEEHQPCTSDFLAMHFSVTSRTIKNYVKEINATFPNIIQSSPRGYAIKTEFLSNIEKHLDYYPPQSSNERIQYILNDLLSLDSGSFLNLYDLCEDLFISYSTLKNELLKLRNRVSPYNLTIINKRDAIALEGSETDKRKLISDLLYGESSSNFLDFDMIQKKFPDIDISFIRHVFLDSFNENGYFINDYSLTNLILHTAISIDRIRNKNFSSQRFATPVQMKSHIYSISLEIIKQFEKRFNLHYIELEIYELALLIMSRSTPIDYTNLEESNVAKFIQPEHLALAKELLAEIKDIYGIDLNDDRLLNCFSLHLQSLFIRSNNQSLNKNPLTNTIKFTCPFFFDVAVHLSAIIKKRTGVIINDDEISYIAIHLGCMFSELKAVSNKILAMLYCPHYYGMVQNLVKQINQSFAADLTIIDVATNEAMITTQKNIDLIISIMPLTKPSDILHVQIGLFLSKQDKQRIQQNIAIIKAKKYRDEFEIQLRQLFLPALFEKVDGCNSPHACISSMCKKLEKHGFADHRLLDEILEREAMSSTAFDLFAIPHSTYMRSQKTLINILISRRPIIWDQKQISIVIMMCFNKNDRNKFQAIYETISSVLIERENVKNLAACDSYEEFITTFLDLINVSS